MQKRRAHHHCARGGLINEADLKVALESGQVAGAALDVFEVEPAKSNPLFGMENVVCTPHLGASTTEAQENVAVQVAEQMADYLTTGAVTNALNIPSMSAEDAKNLAPYIMLVDQLGSFAGQLTENGLKKIEIEYDGKASLLNSKPLTAVLLKGLLSPLFAGVNMVNAPLMAKDRSIEVSTISHERAGDYSTLIKLTVTTDKRTRTVAATLFAGEPRIVEVNGIKLEAGLGPRMLYVNNDDKPGFIGALGSLLGQSGINIAYFHLGRNAAGSEAVALVEVDQEIPQAQLDEIAKLPSVKQVNYSTSKQVAQVNVGAFRHYLVYLTLYLLWTLAIYVATAAVEPRGLRISGAGTVSGYTQIIQSGYAPQDYKALAFPPGYPMLLSALGRITGIDPVVIAPFLNLTALFFAFTLATELLCRLMKIRSRYLMFILNLSIPAAYFTFSIYTDTLFMLLLWGVLYLALLHSGSKASIAGQILLFTVLPSVRIAGYALFSWLLLRRWTALALVIPALAWLALNNHYTGDPLFFVDVQKRFNMPKGTIFDGAYYSLLTLTHVPKIPTKTEWLYYIQMSFLPLFYFFGLLATAWWFWRRDQKLIALTIVSILAISHYGAFGAASCVNDLPITPFMYVPLLLAAEKHREGISLAALCLGALLHDAVYQPVRVCMPVPCRRLGV